MADQPPKAEPTTKVRPPKKPKHSVFGPPVGSRPDVLTDAETVAFPQLTTSIVQLMRPELLAEDESPEVAEPAEPAEGPESPEADSADTAEKSLLAIEEAIRAAEEFLASLDSPDRYGTDFPDPTELEDLDLVLPSDAAKTGDHPIADVDVSTTGPFKALSPEPAPPTAPYPVLPVAVPPVPGLPAAESATAAPIDLPAVQERSQAPRLRPSAARDVVGDPAGVYVAPRRRTQVSRLVLLGILLLQAVLSLRLRNTAFEDEALYLYAGHMELNHLLHGTALQGNYASYFSGAPVLYPVLAAVLDNIGGLTLARLCSLAEMLATTALLYSITRRLFNERAALLAAAMFGVCESVSFLGNFATYDATCLFLLACGAWIMVRTAANQYPVYLLAAPVVALAVGVKYAGAMFVPTIALLPALAGWPARGRRVLLRPVFFGLMVAMLLYGGLTLGGADYRAALSSTTTNRAEGTTPFSTLLHETVNWGGLVILLAITGTYCYTRRVRTEPGEGVAPAGGWQRRLALGVVLTGTAFLAPLYQAHLHTDVSFHKHIGFGLFFAAPIAGLGLARVIGDHFRRPQFGIAFWCAALVLGMIQASGLYHAWPSTTTFTDTLSRYLKPNAQYLVEVDEVPIYYLRGHADAQPDQFTSTYNILYYNSKGQGLTGNAGYQAAIKAGYFHVVAYNEQTTPAVDAVLAKALKSSGKYYVASSVTTKNQGYPETWTIWVEGKKPGTAKATAKKPAATKKAVTKQK